FAPFGAGLLVASAGRAGLARFGLGAPFFLRLFVVAIFPLGFAGAGLVLGVLTGAGLGIFAHAGLFLFVTSCLRLGRLAIVGAAGRLAAGGAGVGLLALGFLSAIFLGLLPRLFFFPGGRFRFARFA